MNLIEFYPTPRTLLDKVLEGVDYRYVKNVLEPSAGKGDIVDYIKEKASVGFRKNTAIEFDCIELDETLRNTLVGAGKRVVHDNFLTYNTCKAYDLIIANPPFSEGDKHLSKALDMQEKTGGDLIFIINAETIRNPYSNLRKVLLKRLEDAGAVIEFMEDEFASAERRTNVEIAVVKVHYDAPEYGSDILKGLKRKYYPECDVEDDIAELAPKDPVEAIARAYEIEAEAGVQLIKEYKALEPRLFETVGDRVKPLLSLKCGDEDASVNGYVEAVRLKYWRKLFEDKRITGQMTSNLHYSFMSRLNDLKDYDVSIYNIKALQAEMNKDLISGIEDCIIKLFDELSNVHAHYEGSTNIHYYNGWSTNKAWIINRKVIIPFYEAVWNRYTNEYQPEHYEVVRTLSDIEKALNYLDGGLTDGKDLEDALIEAKKNKQTKNIQLKYFDITFHKKGTVHIVFRDEELLKKFNIFGSQKKGWLPPSYGKKKYSEMDMEEKSVIDAFEGEASYNKIMAEKKYYLFDACNMALIEDKTA